MGMMLILPVFQFSRYFKPLQGLHIVKNLPLSMVAGSAYEWEVSFVNPKSEEGFMNITLEITEKKTVIGFEEFSIEGALEAYDNPPQQHHYSTLTFTETEGGIFQNQTSIEERFTRISLRISSVPNLMSGTYTFTLTVTIQYVGSGVSNVISGDASFLWTGAGAHYYLFKAYCEI